MNGTQIVDALKFKLDRNKVDFWGCFTSDEIAKFKIPFKHNKPIQFVSNILSRYSKVTMGHWVLFHIQGNVIFFFDSFAMKPALYSDYFKLFLRAHPAFSLKLLNTRLQGANSLVCGAYVVQTSHWLSIYGMNGLPRKLNKMYSKKYDENDSKVLRFVYRHFDMPQCSKVFCDGLTYTQCKKLCSG